MITINEELRKLLPPLRAEEYADLEENILLEGCTTPITLWNNTIIDGHNRYEICQRHNLPFKTISMEFENLIAVKRWMIKHQRGTRNLNNFQLAELALIEADILKEEARERMLAGVQIDPSVNSRECRIDPVLNSAQGSSGRVVEQLAKQVGIGKDTIQRVSKIIEKASPDQIDSLRAGEVSVNAVYKELRAEEKKQEFIERIEVQKKEIELGNVNNVDKLYDVISIDPPWPYGANYDPTARRSASPYPEMRLEDIQNISLPTKDNCVLFLWTTHKFLPHSFQLLEQWGFDYKATLVWDKESLGMGHWFRMQCEFCLFAIKGNPFWMNTKVTDIIREKRREHSRKPESFFEMISKICIGNRLEYFSRQQREGWDSFGNDVSKFDKI